MANFDVVNFDVVNFVVVNFDAVNFVVVISLLRMSYFSFEVRVSKRRILYSGFTPASLIARA